MAYWYCVSLVFSVSAGIFAACVKLESADERVTDYGCESGPVVEVWECKRKLFFGLVLAEGPVDFMFWWGECW